MYDLLLVLLFSLLLMPVVELSQIAILRVVFGLFYVAFLPGYALVAAVFPSRDDLEVLERLGLSLMLSISAVALVGFLLNLGPWGIRLASILISLNSLTLVACATAWWRRKRLPPEMRFVMRVKVESHPWRDACRTNRFLALTLVLAVTAAFASILYTALKPGPQETFTEFYVLGPTGKFEAYPEEITPSQPIDLIIGVANHEHANVQYRIERVDPSSTEQVAAIQLAHGETWEQPYTLTLIEPGEQEVDFLLYKENEEEPYRSLYMWTLVSED